MKADVVSLPRLVCYGGNKNVHKYNMAAVLKVGLWEVRYYDRIILLRNQIPAEKSYDLWYHGLGNTFISKKFYTLELCVITAKIRIGLYSCLLMSIIIIQFFTLGIFWFHSSLILWFYISHRMQNLLFFWICKYIFCILRDSQEPLRKLVPFVRHFSFLWLPMSLRY